MRATGQTPEQAAAAKKETMLLIGAIVATLSVISGIMVSPYASILFPYNVLIGIQDLRCLVNGSPLRHCLPGAPEG